MAQSQVSSNKQALFNVQEQLNGALQQLERLERVESGVDRPSKLKRSSEGDSNHVTVQDNLEALISKLMALSSTLNYYKGQFGEGCVAQLVQWYEERQGNCSPVVKKAVADTLDACLGQFTYSPPSANMDEASLRENAAKLAEAVNKFHSKEARFDKDPKAYENKQPYSVTRYKSVDAEAFREQLRSSEQPSVVPSATMPAPRIPKPPSPATSQKTQTLSTTKQTRSKSSPPQKSKESREKCGCCCIS